MNDLAYVLDFVVDVVCMMPPLQEVATAGVSQEVSIALCFGAVAVFGFSLIARTATDMFGDNKIAAIIVAVCVATLAFGFIEQSLWKAVFLVGYPAMVIAPRVGEGILVGSRLSSRLRAWHVIPFAAVAAVLYLALKPLPQTTLSIAKGAWAAFGAVLAAVIWTRTLRKSNRPAFGNPLAAVATFVAFLSTLLYVSASPCDQLMYRLAVPCGIVAGFCVRKKRYNHDAMSEGE